MDVILQNKHPGELQEELCTLKSIIRHYDFENALKNLRTLAHKYQISLPEGLKRTLTYYRQYLPKYL